MQLTWIKTVNGYSASGATTTYQINRTPGHRFALVVNGDEVRQGKLVELKAAAQANESAGDAPAKPAPKLRTHRKSDAPKPVTTTVPASAIHREYVAAVDKTDRGPIYVAHGEEVDCAHGPVPDYVPPEVGRPRPESPAAEYARQKAEGVVGPYVPAPRPVVYETNQGPVVHIPFPVPPGAVQDVLHQAAEIRTGWAEQGRTRDDLVGEFGGVLGVNPDDDRDDDIDSDVDTPLVPTIPDPIPNTNGVEPVWSPPAASNSGGTRLHRFHARSPMMFRPFLRPPAPVVGQDGRPVTSWLPR